MQNSCFSSILTTGDVLQGGTSATQRQQFHTDDVDHCLRRVVKMRCRLALLLAILRFSSAVNCWGKAKKKGQLKKL